MPGFDQTGPLGEGPMTGGGRGRCVPGRDVATGRPQLFGLGRGGRPWGGGRGRGRGFGGGFGRRGALPAGDAPNMPVEDPSLLRDEIRALSDEVAALRAELAAVKSPPRNDAAGPQATD